MKPIINIFILLVLLVSCDNVDKKPAEELINELENHPKIEYLEINLDILKVNKTYYCDLVESKIYCMDSNEVENEFNCTKENLDKMFSLVRKSGAFAVQKNENGQVLFAKGDFMNDFHGHLYSPEEIDLNEMKNHFTTFFISRVEKEHGNWYRVE